MSAYCESALSRPVSVVSWGNNRVAPAMPPVERERSSLEDGSAGSDNSTQLNNRPRSKLQFGFSCVFV